MDCDDGDDKSPVIFLPKEYNRGDREREFYLTPVGPKRGHMAADAAEKRL